MPEIHQHILVPVNFSHHATLALEEAADLAHKYQADVTVVYVIPQAIFHPDRAADIEDALDISDITDEAKTALANMISPYREDGLPISEHVLAGGPILKSFGWRNALEPISLSWGRMVQPVRSRSSWVPVQ